MPLILTGKDGRNHALPRLEAEGADVFVGSPLAIIGLWVFAIRERLALRDAYPMPWVYDPDYRPADDQDGFPPPDGSPRKVVVESSYNTEKAVRNYRPAIYVGRGGGSLKVMKTSVDNLASTRERTGLKAYHCMVSMAITIECESDNAGESSALAETIWGFILATRDIFRTDFGLHDIIEPSLSDTQYSKRDKDVWVTAVQFEVIFDQRWGTEPIAPVLRDIAARINARAPSASEFFVDIATQSVGR
jgi:hypothetical protein